MRRVSSHGDVGFGEAALEARERPMGVARRERERLSDERKALTHHFSIKGDRGPVNGYITVGFYDDGRPGEIFITIAKKGSLVRGLLNDFAIAISIALQYGVPLRIFADKYINEHYEPAGPTGNKDIPIAKSIVDYVFRWLISRPEISD